MMFGVDGNQFLWRIEWDATDPKSSYRTCKTCPTNKGNRQNRVFGRRKRTEKESLTEVCKDSKICEEKVIHGENEETSKTNEKLKRERKVKETRKQEETKKKNKWIEDEQKERVKRKSRRSKRERVALVEVKWKWRVKKKTCGSFKRSQHKFSMKIFFVMKWRKQEVGENTVSFFFL